MYPLYSLLVLLLVSQLSAEPKPKPEPKPQFGMMATFAGQPLWPMALPMGGPMGGGAMGGGAMGGGAMGGGAMGGGPAGFFRPGHWAIRFGRG